MTELMALDSQQAENAGPPGGVPLPKGRAPLRWLRRLIPHSIAGIQILFLAVVLVPIMLVQIGVYWSGIEVRRGQELQANREIARSVATTFEVFIRDVLHEELLLGLALSSRQPGSLGQVDSLLAEMARESPSIYGYSWLDSTGQVLASSDPGNPGTGLADPVILQGIFQGKDWVVTDLFQIGSTGEPAFIVARGIRDGEGNLRSIVSGAVDPRRLGQVLQLSREPRGAFIIADSQGNMVYHSPDRPLSWEERTGTHDQPLLVQALRGEEGIGTITTSLEKEVRVAGSVPVRSLGWVAAASRPEAEVMDVISRSYTRDVALLFLVSTAASLMALLVGKNLTSPIRRLRTRAVELGQGHLEGGVEVSGPKELEELAVAFNRMSGELLAREQEHAALHSELEQRNQELTLASTTNLELADRAESIADRLRGIQYVMEAVLSHLVLDELLDELLGRVRQLLEGDIASLLLMDEDGQALVVRATKGAEAELRMGMRVPMGHGIAGRVATERKPMVFEDLSEVDTVSSVFREKVQSVLGVPLLVDDQVIGVIHVGSMRSRHFTDEDLRLLQVVADRVALGIDRARLYESERKARAEAEQQAAEINALLQNLGEAVTIADGEGHIILRNRAAREISGISDEQLEQRVGEQQPNLLQPDGSPLPYEEWPLKRAQQGEQFTGREYLIARPDGSQRHVVLSGSSVEDREGRVVLAINVYRDVTALRQLEQMKEEYVSLISHDLRAPLSVVMGRSYLILRDPSKLEQVETNAQSIVTSAKRMNAMIQDLVDSSRLEAGQLQLDLESVDLPTLILELMERMSVVAEMDRVQVTWPTGLPPVLADANRLERIMTNLLTNALKYSDPGSEVAVSVERQGGFVHTLVTDRGPGIPPEEIPKLFQRYRRAPASGERREGLGLGLYITRMLVEAHGGEIRVESTVGQGSTFRFSLPVGGTGTAS